MTPRCPHCRAEVGSLLDDCGEDDCVRADNDVDYAQERAES